MSATYEQLDQYARWMCHALDTRGREVILRNYRIDYGDEEADWLEEILECRLNHWNGLTEVQRQAVINREGVKARKALNS